MNRSKVITALLWKLLERGGSQGIQFIVQIILARLLLPSDFGAVALLLVFVNLSQVFVVRGFKTALIQKKEIDNEDISTVFFLSIALALLFYIILYFIAPIIAKFYNMPVLVSSLRVLGLTLFFGAFNSIQLALISRAMAFKKLLYSSLIGIFVSGVIGITMAYNDFGVWALVAQLLSNQIIISIVLMFVVPWRPIMVFSVDKASSLFSYGWKLLVATLLNVLYYDLRTLIIGRLYTPAVLGYYNRGQKFPNLLVSNINSSIQAVIFPALSQTQDNLIRVKAMVRRGIVTSAFLLFPMMIGMAVIAEPMVKVILTDKWLPAVYFLQIFSISQMLMPIHTANLQAINAVGRSDIFLKLEIIKKVIGLIILGISIPFGVYAMAWGMLVSSIISSFINAYPNKKLLNYSYVEQLKDIVPYALLAIIMGGFVLLLNDIHANLYIQLLIQIIVGALSYFIVAMLLRLEAFNYLFTTIKSFIIKS